eukprot:s576_g11.t3
MGKRGQNKSDSFKESDRKRKKGDEAAAQKAAGSSKKAKEESNAKKTDQRNKSKGDLQNVKKQEEKKESKEPINPKSEDAKDSKDEDNEEESRQLDALLGDAPDVSDEKGFKRKQREEAALLQVQPVETDTEYDQPDISSYPEKLVIEGSSYDKLDGMYRILPKPSRGRPAYCKVGSSKNLYLYWYSGKRWQIGFEFGAKKCVASIQDTGHLRPPLDPYPHIWKAIEKNSTDGVKKEKPAKDKLKCFRMRVFEERFRQPGTEFFEEMDSEMSQAVEFAQKSRYETMTQTAQMAQEKEDSQEPEQEPSSSSQPSAPSKPAQSKTRTKAVKRPSPKKPAVSKAPKNMVVDEEAAIVMKHQQSDSDDESKATGKATSSQPSDSNAETSDSDSDDESSSSESFSEAEEPDPDFEAMGEKAKDIANKLKYMERAQAASKFNQLMDSRRKSKNGGFSPIPQCTVADMKYLFKWGARHLGVVDPFNNSAPPPPAAAPRTPEQPQPRTPPPVEEDAPRSDAVAQLPHHTMAAPKSVLKRPGQPSGPVRRVQHAQEDFQVMVTSHKSCGEGLWFQCPGSLVNCDTCNRSVPQAMGCLQGAPARSQFAQHLFLCQDCSTRPG